jgi:hypothetical protein
MIGSSPELSFDTGAWSQDAAVSLTRPLPLRAPVDKKLEVKVAAVDWTVVQRKAIAIWDGVTGALRRLQIPVFDAARLMSSEWLRAWSADGNLHCIQTRFKLSSMPNASIDAASIISGRATNDEHESCIVRRRQGSKSRWGASRESRKARIGRQQTDDLKTRMATTRQRRLTLRTEELEQHH